MAMQKQLCSTNLVMYAKARAKTSLLFAMVFFLRLHCLMVCWKALPVTLF